MEARILNNQIVLPIGTAIGFSMVGKNHQKISLKVTESEDNSKFFAVFDENDVDFEININNTKCIHGIGYTLIVNNGFYDYYVGPGEVWSMEALYTKGRKLHFISQNTEIGQNVIKQTAEDYDLTYSESAAVCSRIEFSFEVEKVKQREVPIVRSRGINNSYDILQRSERLDVLGDIGSPPHPPAPPPPPHRSMSQSLGFSSLSFGSGRDVIDCDEDYSCDEQVMRKRINNVAVSPMSASSSLSKTTGSLSPVPPVASLAKVWNIDTSAQLTEQPKQDQKVQEIGDKGVVVFGEQSNQFYDTYDGFTKDKDLTIKPFVVELRFSKN